MNIRFEVVITNLAREHLDRVHLFRRRKLIKLIENEVTEFAMFVGLLEGSPTTQFIEVMEIDELTRSYPDGVYSTMVLESDQDSWVFVFSHLKKKRTIAVAAALQNPPEVHAEFLKRIASETSKR